MPLAKAGVDLALNDLLGHISGCSLAQLWGKNSWDGVELSWTLNPVWRGHERIWWSLFPVVAEI
jgi:L-alanine-DL-glutamate epimerase-like enolase superfamily enzyme